MCDLLQIAELKSGVAQPADAAFLPPIARANSRNGSMFAYATISVTVVGEFVHWNEEAVARCNLLMSQVLMGTGYYMSPNLPVDTFLAPFQS